MHSRISYNFAVGFFGCCSIWSDLLSLQLCITNPRKIRKSTGYQSVTSAIGRSTCQQLDKRSRHIMDSGAELSAELDARGSDPPRCRLFAAQNPVATGG